MRTRAIEARLHPPMAKEEISMTLSYYANHVNLVHAMHRFPIGPRPNLLMPCSAKNHPISKATHLLNIVMEL